MSLQIYSIWNKDWEVLEIFINLFKMVNPLHISVINIFMKNSYIFQSKGKVTLFYILQISLCLA